MDKNTAITKFKEFLASKIAMDEEAFSLAYPLMEIVTLKKGDFYVENQKVSRHFAFIASGIMRAFENNDGEEKIETTITVYCRLNAAWFEILVSNHAELF